MNARTWTGPALLLCAILLWPAVAAAQFDPFMPVPIPPLGPAQPAPQTVAPQRSQTVTERPRPLYDALGIRLEEFFLYPRLELDESYNDNIFATSSGAKSDFITDLKPRLDLVSNFGRHAFNLSAGADIGWYATHSTENYQDAFTSASGRYDIDQGRHIFANAGIDRLHVARSSPDFPGAAAGISATSTTAPASSIRGATPPAITPTSAAASISASSTARPTSDISSRIIGTASIGRSAASMAAGRSSGTSPGSTRSP